MTQEKDPILRERLDRAGRLITKAAALSERESTQVAESSFLFARIKARIASEQQALEGH